MPYRQVGLICPSESVNFLMDYLKKLRFDVRALWTPDPELTIQAAAEYEIPFSASRPDDVLLKKEVQIIIITGRPQIHSQIAVKALGIGKHVLCDSPVTLNTSDALKMVQAAQYYPQLLALVGYGLRHLNVFRNAREFIESGYLGTLIACECSVRTGSLLIADNYDWHWEYSMGGGVLNLIGCHVIDILSYLIQKRATRVQGLVKCSGLAASYGRGYPEDENETDLCWMNGNSISDSTSNAGVGFRRANADDFASFLLKFDNDFVATITLNALFGSETSGSIPSYFDQRIFISGTDGQLEIRNHDLYGMRFRSDFVNGDIGTSKPVQNGCTNNPKAMELIYSETGENPVARGANGSTVMPGLYLRGFLNLLRHLADALPAYEQQQIQNSPGDPRKQSGAERKAISWQTGCLASLASFEDAQYVRAVINAVRDSSEKGDWIKVDLRQQEDPPRHKANVK